MDPKEILLSIKNILKQYKFTNVQLSDKSLIQFQGDELKKGLPVSLMINSKASPLPTGDYKTLDGVSFSIDNGIVSKLEGKSNKPKAGPVLQAQAADKEPYGDVEYADPGYQKDKQKRYPLDTDAHIKNAWARINQDQDASQYSPEDLNKVKDKIESAMKKIDPKDKSLMDKDGRSTINPPDPNSATPEDTVETKDDDFDEENDDQTTGTPLTLEAFTAALQPLMDSMKNVETAMCGEMSKQNEKLTAMSKEIADNRDALNSTVEVVEVLANKADGKPIEPKKAHPFKKDKDPDFTQSKTYKAFHQMHLANK